MKAIDIVKEYLKGTCNYSNTVLTGGGRLFGCTHERVKEARFDGYYPNQPCTIDDWKVCPLNPEWIKQIEGFTNSP
jgi:hypothetical protein